MNGRSEANADSSDVRRNRRGQAPPLQKIVWRRILYATRRIGGDRPHRYEGLDYPVVLQLVCNVSAECGKAICGLSFTNAPGGDKPRRYRELGGSVSAQ